MLFIHAKEGLPITVDLPKLKGKYTKKVTSDKEK